MCESHSSNFFCKAVTSGAEDFDTVVVVSVSLVESLSIDEQRISKDCNSSALVVRWSSDSIPPFV